MQKSFSFGNPKVKDFPQLKKMWADVFGDSDAVINNFFENTAEAQNIFCAFCNGKPVSVLYAIDSTIAFCDDAYKAYYVYAVCTEKEYRGKGLMKALFDELEKTAKSRNVSYLFLVPAENSLFSMYEKIGFKVGFTYKERQVSVSACEMADAQEDLSFETYKRFKHTNGSVPVALLNEKGFSSFYRPVEAVGCVSVNDAGYVVFERDNGYVVVHELFGDEEILLSHVSKITNEGEFLLREACAQGGKPYGMLKALDSSLYFDNGFFGVPYGG